MHDNMVILFSSGTKGLGTLMVLTFSSIHECRFRALPNPLHSKCYITSNSLTLKDESTWN